MSRYALLGSVDEVESERFFVGRIGYGRVVNQVLGWGEVWSVGRYSSGKAMYFFPERLYERAFPPYVDHRALGRVASPAERGRHWGGVYGSF